MNKSIRYNMYNKEISLGNLFEAEALSAISKLEGYMPATEQQDRFEGTDLFYYGTRITNINVNRYSWQKILNN